MPKKVTQQTISQIVIDAIKIIHPDKPQLIIINRMRMRMDIFMHYHAEKLKPYLAKQKHEVHTYVHTPKPELCIKAKK